MRKDSNTAVDLTKSKVSTSKPHRDRIAQKASRDKWNTSGGRINNELRKRLKDNDREIGKRDSVLKPWKGKKFGDDPGREAKNIRLRDMANKQIQLHKLLLTSTGANATAELRGGLQPWADDKVEEYESQLDAIISALRKKPSANPSASKQQTDSDSVDDLNDDIALPLSSPQQRMADAPSICEATWA